MKKIFDVDRTGHSGTLDPQVTGVLVIALSESTKVLQAISRSDKEYVCLMKLHGDVKSSDLKKVLSDYQGEITQMPPVKSAVKRALRKRRIYRIELLEREERYVLFKVYCEAGTYIRKLCHDMGKSLGTGAHMAELRRTIAGSFTEDECVKLQDLRDAWEEYKAGKKEDDLRKFIHPMEELVRNKPKIWVKDSTVDALCHGSSLKNPGICRLTSDVEKNKFCAILTLKNELVAMAQATQDAKEIMKSSEGEAAKLERVTMQTDTYPKWTKSQI